MTGPSPHRAPPAPPVPASSLAAILTVAVGVLLVAAVCLWPASASAQPKFGIEVEGGRNIGLTPYLRSLVYSEAELLGESFDQSESFRPYLGNARAGWGTNLEVRVVARQIYGSLSFRWFEVGDGSVHYKGFRPNHESARLRPTRIRPDGSIDDAAVQYRELESPVRFRLSEARRANLLVFGLNGGYRFYVYQGSFDVFIPVGGGLIATHLTGRRNPVRPGLEARSGVGGAFDFASILSLVVNARLHGLVTPNYLRRSDAARRAAETGGNSGSAFFSAMLYPSLNVSLRFTIR